MSKQHPIGFKIRSIAYILAVIVTTVLVAEYFVFAANTTIGNNISTSGTLTVTGASTLSSTLLVSGRVNASSTLQATGDVHFYGDLTVDGTTNIAGLSFTTATVTGNFYVGGDVSVAGGDINLGTGSATTTLTSSSGRLGIGTTSPSQLFSVQGNAYFSGSLINVANITATGTLTVSGTASSSIATALGIASTSPWGTFSVEMGINNPAFVVSNNGSTTPSLFVGGVNQNGYVGIGTTTPSEAFSVVGNISNIADSNFTPKLSGSVTIPTKTVVVYVSGKYAYLTTDTSAVFQIYDVSTSSPALVSSVSLGGNAQGVYVDGRYAYIAHYTDKTVKIFDIAKPSNPVQIGSVVTGTGPLRVVVSGRYAYVITLDSSALQIIDISDPTQPKSVGLVSTAVAPRNLQIAGQYVYVVNSTIPRRLEIFNVSDPSKPYSTGSATISSDSYGVDVDGKYAYVTSYTSNELQIFDVSTSSPSLISAISTETGPGTVRVTGKYAYVANDSGSLQVFDISNPSSPKNLGSSATDAAPNDLFISGRRAYVVNYTGNTFQIFDLGGLETTSALIYSLEAGELVVRKNIITQGQLQTSGGLSVGAGGILSAGPLAVSATTSRSSFLGGLVIGTSTPATTSPNFLQFQQSTAVIEATSSGSVPLTLRGAGTQLTNLLQVQNSADTNLFFLNSAGGFVTAGASSTISGSLNVSGQLYASSTLSVANLASLNGGFVSASASSTVSGILNVNGTLSASSTLTVGSLASLNGAFISVGSSTVTNSLQVSGQLYASSTLSVANLASLNGGFISVASSTAVSSLQVSGQLYASSTLSVANLASLNGGFIASGASSTVSGILNVNGTLSASSTLTVGSLASLNGAFISVGSSTIAGSLNVSSPLSASSTVTIAKTLTVSGDSYLTNASTTGMLTIGNGFISSASSTIANSFHISGNLQASSSVSLATTTITVNFASGSPNVPAAGIPLTLYNTQSATNTQNRLAFQIAGATSTWTTSALTSELTQNFDPAQGILTFSTLNAGVLSEAARLTDLRGLIVKGSSTISNSLNVSGPLSASSTLSVASLAKLDGAFISVGSSTIAGSLQVSAPLSASSTLTVTSLAGLDGGFISGASSTVIGNFSITGALRSSSTATSTFANGIKLVGGCFQLVDGTCAGAGGGLTIGGAVSGGTANRVLYEDGSNLLAESASLTFDGTTLIVVRASTTGMFTIGTGFIASASSTIANSLNVTGPLSASSTLSVASLAKLDGAFISVGSSTIAGSLNVSGPLSASSTLTVSGLARLESGFISNASSTISSGNLTLTGSGANFGIGTSTPYARLSIKADVGNATRLISVASSSGDIYFEISSTGTTTIDQLQTGVMSFDTNAGVVTWIDLPVTSGAAYGVVQSYSAMVDASTTLTVYAESDGAGGIIRQKVGIGTSTPWGMLSVEKTTATTSPMFVVSSSGSSSPYFIISSRGYVGINGTSSPGFPLSVIGNIGVTGCVKSATSTYLIGPDGCAPAADIAESYLVSEIIEPGDVVALDENNPISLVKAVKSSKLILGAISSQPAVLFEGSISSFGAPETQSSYAVGDKAPLALTGRIPVKINLEGGEIKAGDPITASLEPGIGRRASTSGIIIGYALEDFSGPTEQNQGLPGQGKVLMLISLGNWQAPLVESEEGEEGDGLLAQVVALVKEWLESVQVFIENGLVRLKELVAEKITSKKAVFEQVELKDEAGQTYCVQIQSGSLATVAGECPELPSE